MKSETLWEAICRLAGPGGAGTVSLTQAIQDSAVPETVANAEIQSLIEDGLVVPVAGRQIRLTETGRQGLEDQHHTAEISGTE